MVVEYSGLQDLKDMPCYWFGNQRCLINSESWSIGDISEGIWRMRRDEVQAGIEGQKDEELLETEKGNVIETLGVDI